MQNNPHGFDEAPAAAIVAKIETALGVPTPPNLRNMIAIEIGKAAGRYATAETRRLQAENQRLREANAALGGEPLITG